MGKPRCGYSGYGCVLSTGLIIGVAVGAFVVLFLIGGSMIVYFLRLVFQLTTHQLSYSERLKYQVLQKTEWEIPYTYLEKLEFGGMENLKSIRSVQSMSSGNSRTDENLNETENHCFFFYKKAIVYANKHPIRVKLSKSDINLLRQVSVFIE